MQLNVDFSEKVTASMDKYVMGEYLEETEQAEMEFTLNAALSSLPEKSDEKPIEVSFRITQSMNAFLCKNL